MIIKFKDKKYVWRPTEKLQIGIMMIIFILSMIYVE